MGKRIVSKLRPILMSLLIAAAVMFAVLGITTAIISDTATVKAESEEHSHDGYTAWTSSNSLPDLAGSYYLTADVTIASGTWSVPTGTTYLCLNGHGIIGNNGNSVITVGSGAVLYLEDCLDTAHKYTVDANHLATVDDSLEGVEGVDYFTFTGGYITGAKRTANNSVGGGVNIEGGTLYINGGTIIGNSADRGGGVRCGGTLVMNGGAIRNNNAKTASGGGQRNGGGLFINTTFTMNGGIITENWCANAGGAILLQSTATSFIMNGGAIVNNYNRGLSNNMAQKPVQIGSGAIIEGNVDTDGNPCDIWLLQSGNKIELLGELSNNKPIGVYMGNNPGTFTSGLSGKGTAANFISTNDAYFVKLNGDGEAQLVEKVVSVTVGETVTYYDNVSDALSAWTDGSTLTLLKDVNISSTIVVSSGTKTLDLNGHGIRLTSGTTVIKVNSGSFTLCDCGDTTHYFTAPENDYGKATNISDIDSGGQSSFTGGYITGGTAQAFDTGGGVHVTSGATFIMKGGTIIGNGYQGQEHIRGGGVAVLGGTFEMQGGAIMYNIVNNEGGGVYLRDGANMQMTGGIVSHNYAINGSGGVHVSAGVSFSMSGGEIAYNRVGTTAGEGGGMCAYQGSLTMTGGSIHHNSVGANGVGGGVLYKENGNLIVSGSASIINNTAGEKTQNIYIINKSIQIADALTAGAQFGVTMHSNATGTFTSGWATYMGNVDPADYFTSDIAGDTVIKDHNGELMMLPENAVAVVENGTKFTYYNDFNSALSAWGDGGTLTLLKDVTAQITTSGGNKTLDLNDHSITYTGGTVIIVSGGTLTICDNSENKTVHYYLPNQNGVATLSATKTDYYFEGGYITGGVATEGRGGGLRILGDGNVLFDSGTIFANSAGWGGGVWTSGSGSLTIEGTAAVIGNYSSGAYTSGGGMFMEGSSAVTMTGGSICHNSSEWSGGGIRDCVSESSGARFTMTGGEITGNYAKNNQGNGFCFDAATTFNIGGTARIFGNQGTNDIYFYNDRYLTVVAPFEEGALIGVTLQGGTGTFTSGWNTYMEDADPSDYFTSDNGSYEIRLSDGEAYTGPHIHNWVFTADKNVITATCASVNKGTCDMANQTLTITASSKTYDGTAVTAQLSLSDGWTTANGLKIPSIYYSDGVNEATTTAPVSVGTYTASVTVSEKTAVVEFTITKAVLTITAEAKEKVYGENDPSFTYTQSGLVGSDTITGELSRESGENVGTYAILQGTLSAGDNYDITYVGANLVINKKALTITAEAKEKIYGENDPSLPYTQSGLVGSDTITGELSRESGENVGEYAITQGALSAGDNYDITYIGANLVINQKTLTITAEAKEKIYGENDPSFTYIQSGLVGSDTITGELSRESGENVGTYAILQGTLSAGDNYNISYVGANLVINKKTLTITAEAKEKIYGENDPSFTYIQSGLVGGDTITGELSRESGENIGTYAISLGTLSSSNNYIILYVGANLVIKQKVETFEPESSDVKIDGLDEEIQEIVSENPTANSISLVVTVETKTDETAVNADSIIEIAKNKSLEFFEIKVEKTIDSVTTVLDATNNVLEIAISYEKAAKKGIAVYSYHGENIITFVESDSKENGTFRVDKENKLVYVYANKFSTYAIGYTPDYRVHTSLSLGSYEGKASVTIKNDADETISFTLESADVKNIVFPDVPKGQYTMTIIWEDGKTNTLTMTLTVGPKAALSAITEQDAESETSEEQVEEQVEEQETQVDSPDIETTDESEILTEDAKIETVAAEDSYVAHKAQAINREVGLVPRKREYRIKREFIFYL